MAVQLVLRKGTSAENDSFTGAEAEVTVDTTNKTLRVHDGTTPGGTPLLVGGSSGATLTDITLDGTTTFNSDISGDLIPSSDVTFDLGSPTNRWNDLYLSGNTIDIGGATISVVGGSFEFKDSSGNDAEVSLAANTTDDLAEGTTNLYYLDTRVDDHLTGGTGVTYSSGTISIGQPVSTTDNVTFNDVTVDGDLIVNGSSTTLNTTTLDVEDLNITVASGAVDSSSANGAGLTVDGANATLTYSNAGDRFVFNKDIEATTLVGQVSDISNHDTDDLTEGTTNLYYTDTRVRNAVSATTGIDYDSATGVFNLADTAVTAGTFGSASEVPVITVDAQGRITSASTTNVAGVSSFSYDSNTGDLDIGTADGSTFTATVDLGPFSTSDLTEGSNLYYTDARVDAHLSGGSGIDFSSGTISHSDTSSVGNVTATSNTFVDSLTFDEFGHVTAVSTSTAAPPNDATITVSAGTGLNGGGNFTTDQSGNETISLDVDTSTIATRSYVDTEVANLVDSSPSTLDTLNELAAALGDDPNFATTVANDIGEKADKTIDINAGSGLTGGGDLSSNRTISHADTSSVSDVTASSNTFVDAITFDTFGHVQTVSTSTAAPPNDATITVSTGSGLSGGGNFTTDQAGNETITVSHADTSSQGSVNASGNTFIQDVTLDGFGHVTGLNTNTLTTSDLGLDSNDGVQHGSLGIGTSAPASGEIVATGDITSNASDDRLKNRLGDIDNALGKVESLSGFYFEFNDTAIDLGLQKGKRVGVSAQEVQNVLPEVVKDSPVDSEYLTVQYEKMVPLLIEAIKEQSSTIEELKTRINTLEEQAHSH